MPSLLENLSAAIAAQEPLVIIYHGGHAPGTRRTVLPSALKTDRLMAYEEGTANAKNFLLEKIEIPSADCTVPWASEQAGMPDDLNAVLAIAEPQVRDIGWHVEILPHGCTLHAFFANGKIRKTAMVGIYDNRKMPRSSELGTDEAQPSRPWHVFEPGFKAGKSFKDTGKALAFFLEQANTYWPNNK